MTVHNNMHIIQNKKLRPYLLPSYIGLRVRYKYYKNIVVLVWSGAAHAPIAVYDRPTSVFRTIDVCKSLSRSAEIWQYDGQKPVLE